MCRSTGPSRVGHKTRQTPGRSQSGGLLATVVAAACLVGAAPAEAATDGVTTPVNGRSRTSFSFRPWLSADGRFLAFDSNAANLVAKDTNGVRDVFVHDRATGVTDRVSLGVRGIQADADSQRPTLSADGRFVAFWSDAANLVEEDTNNVSDAFVVDRDSGLVRRVSVGPGGSEANGASARPVISADGNFIAFESEASDLLPPLGVLQKKADDNEARDVFVHDLTSGVTSRVSVHSDGTEARQESVRPSISADGRFVAFHSDTALDPAVDTNTARDVYVHDRSDGTTVLVSVGEDGSAGDAGSFSPSLSADGQKIAFWSNASNFVADDSNAAGDIFVRDLAAGTTVRVSLASDGAEGDDQSSDPSISPDGRYVAFWSSAGSLAVDDTNGFRDVYLHDRETGITTRVSVASDGAEADADSFSPNVGAGGDLVAFDSEATTLVAGDTNPGSDVFLYSPDP